MSLEREFIYRVAADESLEGFAASDLAELEKEGPVDWWCVVGAYAKYRICRAGGGSRTKCRAEMAEALLKCRAKK